MVSLQLLMGAQITRKYAHNLLVDVYVQYTFNFYSIQHWKVFLVDSLIGLGLVGDQVAPEIVREVGRKIVSRDVNTA